MSALIWSDDYSVNVRAIDNEHKLLLGMVNDIDSAMETDERVRWQLVTTALAQLDLHIRRHFQSEENFLSINRYPDLAQHCEEHRELLQKLEQFERHVRKAPHGLTQGMMIFLKDWLVRHIILHDCKYGSFYVGKQIIMPPPYE